MEALRPVVDHDAEARDTPMNAEERLAYHQTSSAPIMDQRNGGLEQQGAERLVEPHSRLGTAIASL